MTCSTWVTLKDKNSQLAHLSEAIPSIQVCGVWSCFTSPRIIENVLYGDSAQVSTPHQTKSPQRRTLF